MKFSADVVEYQLSNISLLESMYPDPSELSIAPHCLAAYQALKDDPQTSIASDQLEFLHTTTIDQGEIDLIIILPLVRSRVEMNMRQPYWLTRAEWEQVRALPPSTEDDLVVEYLLETMDLIRGRVSGLAKYQTIEEDTKPIIDIGGPSTAKPKSCLQRVWFWFPSLSSKEKRRDLITYAEEHLLTGFLLAGKPGLLCVEGCGKEVDRYMSRIKSDSWSDIPPFQKKVTERLRRPLDQDQRRFQAIVDITDQIPKYGQYNHRGEMGEVKRLMELWGVGEDFSAVVMNTS